MSFKISSLKREIQQHNETKERVGSEARGPDSSGNHKLDINWKRFDNFAQNAARLLEIKAVFNDYN